jgi:hypothetical protein
MKYGMG